MFGVRLSGFSLPLTSPHLFRLFMTTARSVCSISVRQRAPAFPPNRPLLAAPAFVFSHQRSTFAHRHLRKPSHVGLTRGHKLRRPFPKYRGRSRGIPHGNTSRSASFLSRCLAAAATAGLARTTPSVFRRCRTCGGRVGTFGAVGDTLSGAVGSVGSLVPLVRTGPVPAARFALWIVAHNARLATDE